jgi:hypothetical protein
MLVTFTPLKGLSAVALRFVHAALGSRTGAGCGRLGLIADEPPNRPLSAIDEMAAATVAF